MYKDKEHFRLLHKAALIWKACGTLCVPSYGYMEDGKKAGLFMWGGKHSWQVGHDYTWDDYKVRAKDLITSKSVTWNALLVPLARNRIMATDLDSYKSGNDGELILSMIPENHWHQKSGRGGRHDIWRAEPTIAHGAAEGLCGVDVLTKSFIFSFGTCLTGGDYYRPCVPLAEGKPSMGDVGFADDLPVEAERAIRACMPIQSLPLKLKRFLETTVKPQREYKPCHRTEAKVQEAEEILSNPIVPGMRHDSLLSAAGKLACVGWSEGQIYERLESWNRDNNSPKSDKELVGICSYVTEKG